MLPLKRVLGVIFTLLPAGIGSIVINVSVCLSTHVSHKQHVQNFTKRLYMLSVAVAQSSSDGNANTSCTPVLWRMSRFHIMEGTDPNQK